MKNINYHVQNYPVQLIRKEDHSDLIIKDQTIQVPNKFIKTDATSGTISFEIIFSLQAKKKKHLIDREDEPVTSNIMFDFDSDSLEGFQDSQEFYKQDETFVTALCEILTEKLEAGVFNDNLSRHGVDWDADEESVAKSIFVLSADQPQVTRVAKHFSFDAGSEDVLEAHDEFVVDKIKTGHSAEAISKIEKRTWSSIKMKAYQFDEESGFSNVSKSVKENLN